MSAGNPPPDERVNRVGFKVNSFGFCRQCRRLITLSNPDLLACPHCRQPLAPVQYIRLNDLHAGLIGSQELIAFDCVLAGESAPKAAPVKWKARCRRCGKEEEIDLSKEDGDHEVYATFIQSLASPSLGPIPRLVKKLLTKLYDEPCPKKKGGSHEWDVHPIAYRDFKIIKIRPHTPFEDFSSSNVFERTLQAISLETRLDVQVFTAVGRVVPHATKRTLTPIIEVSIPKTEIAKRPCLEEIEEAQRFFYERKVSEWLEYLEPRFAPQIAGREDAKLAGLLTSSSPMFVRIGPRLVLTTLRTLFFGDTRTGKGTIIRWIRDKLGIYEHLIGETARRTGLGFTVDSETSIIIWGILPQADGRLALIEGLHGFPSDQLLQLREALYQGYLSVHMKVSGKRYCRTRIIADANPPRPLEAEAFWVLAIPKPRCFKDPIDITRWDLFIPFARGDVEQEKIMQLQDREDDQEFIKAFRTVVKLAWSLRPHEIQLTPGAYQTLNAKTSRLIDAYAFPLVPLVHQGFRENLLKVSAAFAVISLSLEDGKLVIKPSHIESATEFYQYLFQRWELDAAKDRYTEPGLTESDWLIIRNALAEEDALVKVLEVLALKQLDGRSLAAEVGYAYSYVRKLVAKLKELGLVDRIAGAYSLTKKGVEAFKRLPEIGAEIENVEERGGGE